jgi:hypothetical protein
MLQGFAFMQNLAANTLLKRKTNIGNAQITALILPVEQKESMIDPFAIFLESGLILFTLLMYVPIIFRMVHQVVQEKVSKAKESMRIMGMQDLPYWLSYWCEYSVLNLFISGSCWLILTLSIFGWQDSAFLFLILWTFGQSLFGLIIFTQALFSSPKSAAIATTFVYFGLTLLYLQTDDPDTLRSLKISFSCIFPTIPMCHTVVTFVRFS